MDGNPLVAPVQDTTTAVTGIGIAESAQGLAHGVSNGDWVEAGLSAVGVGLEVLSMAIDPIGTLASYGVSWLIEHVQPLKEALDWFAGDPPVIQSFSETWGNVATEVAAVATDFLNETNAGTAGWTGASGDAYRTHSAEAADAIQGAAALADGISIGVMIMGEVVAFVREFIRDLVGELVGRLISWALELAATLGLATPVVVAQATAAIAKTVSRVADVIRKLVRTIGNVAPRIRKIIDKLDEIIAKLAKLKRTPSGSTPPPTRSGPPPGHHADGSGGGGSTSAAGANGSPPPRNDPPPPPPKGDNGSTSTSGADPSGPPPSGSSPSPPPKGDPPRNDRSIRGDATPQGAHDNPVENRPSCGDPIDLTTGWMILSQTDVELDSTLPLVLSRTHLSNYRLGRSFGRSWSSTVDQRLEVDDTGVAFAAEDGTLLLYPHPAEGQEVLPDNGPRRPLVRTASGGYAILLPEQDRILHFAATTGRERLISAVSDANGRRIEFGRDEHGTVVEVVHSGGYRVRVDSRDGLVTAFWLARQDNDVLLAELRYDAARRLTEVVNSTGTALRFEYDDQERIVRCEDRNGMWYRYFYDSANRCVRAEGAGGYLNYAMAYEPGITRATNSLGHTTVYHLDERYRVVRETDPLGNATTFGWNEHHQRVSHTDPLGRTTSYTYDERGNLVAVTYPDGTRSLGEYDAFGRLVSVVDPDGAVWRREYSPAGALTAVVDPLGGRTTYGYDDLGNLRTVTDAAGGTTTYEVNLLGLVVSATGPDGATTRYAYDELGRKAQVVDRLGGQTLFTWTPEGRPASRVDPDGTRVVLRHDGEGNLRESRDAAGAVTRVDIGTFDLPVAEVRPDGTRLEFAYDTELRPTTVTNEQGRVWRYTYDPVGNLLSEQDFDGRLVRYAYDAAGQLVARTNAAGQVVRYTRDARGRVVARNHADGSARLVYDGVGRVVRATTVDADLVITYDAAGRVLSEAVDGRVLSSRYDALGRRVGRRTPSGALSAWEHDQAGRPTALHTAGRTIRFGYDASGREVERRVGDVLVAQQWDPADRLTSQTVLAGANPTTLQRRSYHYRVDGRLASVDDQLTGGRTFDLDAAGRVTVVRGAHGTEHYGYDPAGNLVHAQSHRGQNGHGPREYRGTLVLRAGNVRYGYDAEGRMVLREVTRPGQVDTWRFGWDAEDRLVWTDTPAGRWRYGYDALGRRVWKRRVAPDGSVLERTDFTWDGTTVAEQVRDGAAALVWHWAPGHRAISQTTRAAAGARWTDQRFQAIVTDLVGTPTELVDPAGRLDWHQDTTLWGGAPNPAGTPLRFPGQYHDDETGLYYNVHRYYDPLVGRYATHDPLGLTPSANPRAYAGNPTAAADPLGLMPAACQTLNNQGHYPGEKTNAFTGYNQYQSGWTSPPGRFDTVPPQTIMNNSTTPFQPHTFDGGVPGQYNASHAELQAWNGQHGHNPVVVTRPMCNSCQTQFQGYANAQGTNVHVGSPDGIHTFTPGGTPQTSLGHNPVQGVDSQGNQWTMTHDQQNGSTTLVTQRPNGQWTESMVRPDYSGTQYYHDPNGNSSYAEYYPNRNTEILTEDANLNTVGETHVGPSNGTYDTVGGNRFNVPPGERM
ncbi:RHS repeat-associated core domain-containing protein [Actinophytocola oryzae]|uniref:RHS repeat-associated protein n=1 Tax=Actinophytocola oryzae TaxID=502181 RepID=A0A4R7VH94_9PSEU|nr:RHS repeat-associated core domain-containing protein [Actinophytocola oryzae]TDV48706.1 RHS repeat-associated protein [Actinophytocola oryzae]